jgi:hypothetical protein
LHAAPPLYHNLTINRTHRTQNQHLFIHSLLPSNHPKHKQNPHFPLEVIFHSSLLQSPDKQTTVTMAKSKATPTPDVYVVFNGTTFDSVHASIYSANARSAIVKAESKEGRVEVHQILGGTVNIEAEAEAPKATTPPKESAPKAAPKKGKATKVEPEAAPAKKTQTLAEQRAANTGGSKAEDEELPENMKALLAGSGSQLSGLTVVVTGVPPTLGRKNADKLVENYGGKLGKSLSKNTDYVVLGNKAGPKK